VGASVKTVDMSGVKDRGAFNTRRVPEGDYAATIVKVEDAEVKNGENKGRFQYLFTFKLEKFSQNSYPYYCQIEPDQLWKLRNVMIAAGVNVPKKRMKLDPNKAVGRKVGVTMEDDEYEGKLKSTIGSVFPVAELADGAMVEDDDSDDGNFDEEAQPVSAVESDEPKAKKKKKAKAEEPAVEEPAKKKGKKKGKKGSEDLEEIDISDV
jgi:hypothetical protein